MKSNLNQRKEKQYIRYQFYHSWMTKLSIFLFQLKLQSSLLSSLLTLIRLIWLLLLLLLLTWLLLLLLSWLLLLILLHRRILLTIGLILSVLRNLFVLSFLNISGLWIFQPEILFNLVDLVPNVSIFCISSHLFEM